MKDDALLARLDHGYENAGLSERRLAMLRWVEKLTRTPGAMTRADAQALMRAGFDDADVLAICEVASYYAYVNRIADGLGVEVEPWTEE